MEKRREAIRITAILLLVLAVNVLSWATQTPQRPGTTTAGTTKVGASSSIDVADLKGKTRRQLAGVFPGTASDLDNWRGWKHVRLDFNGKGRLAALTFTAASALLEAEAKALLTQRFRIRPSEAHYFAAPVVHGYRVLPGAIRTINFTPIPRISQIAIFFNIGYWD